MNKLINKTLSKATIGMCMTGKIKPLNNPNPSTQNESEFQSQYKQFIVYKMCMTGKIKPRKQSKPINTE